LVGAGKTAPSKPLIEGREMDNSEFGSGIVVPLVKFSEHMGHEMLHRFDEAKIDYSHSVELWMNGASDHMFDLDDRAPFSLKELAKLSLTMGHGFTGQVWTEKHVESLRTLWKLSAIEVDRMLGVEPDWGQW
jgi:hypothetical protein